MSRFHLLVRGQVMDFAPCANDTERRLSEEQFSQNVVSDQNTHAADDDRLLISTGKHHLRLARRFPLRLRAAPLRQLIVPGLVVAVGIVAFQVIFEGAGRRELEVSGFHQIEEPAKFEVALEGQGVVSGFIGSQQA